MDKGGAASADRLRQHACRRQQLHSISCHCMLHGHAARRPKCSLVTLRASAAVGMRGSRWCCSQLGRLRRLCSNQICFMTCAQVFQALGASALGLIPGADSGTGEQHLWSSCDMQSMLVRGAECQRRGAPAGGRPSPVHGSLPSGTHRACGARLGSLARDHSELLVCPRAACRCSCHELEQLHVSWRLQPGQKASASRHGYSICLC